MTLDTGNVPTQVPSLAAPVAVPTVDPVAQAEVIQAYSHYWEQRTLAFRDLDPSLLSSVAAGPELAGLTEKIDDLRSEGRAIRTHVIHHFVALPTAPGEAVVADEYEDLSIYVDSQLRNLSTQQPRPAIRTYRKSPQGTSKDSMACGKCHRRRKYMSKRRGLLSVAAVVCTLSCALAPIELYAQERGSRSSRQPANNAACERLGGQHKSTSG